MKQKIVLLIILFFTAVCLYAQKLHSYDKILQGETYKSFYSYQIKAPSFIIYKLYKGGGNIKRTGMTFTGTYPHFNYSNSGYDKGHLADAEDFAYNKEKLLSTFNYVNCIPQSPKLNRGNWKSIETKVRKWSQTDTLIIICGGVDFNNLIPDKCFKIVYNNNGMLIYSGLFKNDNTQKQLKFSDNFLDTFSYNKVISLINRKPDAIINIKHNGRKQRK